MIAIAPDTTKTLLPEQLDFFYLNKSEFDVICQDVQDYLSNGIELHEGDVLFDVGANIGVFSVWAYRLCNNNLNVYAFEPIPDTFKMLQANAWRFSAGLIKVFPYGLSQEAKTVTFAYYPNAPVLSTAYPDEGHQHQIRQEFTNNLLRNFSAGTPYMRLLGLVPKFLRPYILNLRLAKTFQVQKVTCQMKTVSQIIREQGIERIDLLKIDVEKSELDIVLGIELQDWPKIKQVVLEVHDLHGELKQIMDLLEQHGFDKIVVEQTPLFKGSNLFNLYARRSVA